MTNGFYEPWRHQSWTSTDFEHNSSDWQTWHDCNDHSVARTSTTAGFDVAFGTLRSATRRALHQAKSKINTSNTRASSMSNDEFNAVRRRAKAINYDYRGTRRG